jgi:hypothetical protein
MEDRLAHKPAVQLVTQMPDVVKVTVVGLALDPPTFDDRLVSPTLVMTLDHLVEMGIAVAAIDGSNRSYRLTQFGVAVYDEAKARSPSDATLPANDMAFESPGDAA